MRHILLRSALIGFALLAVGFSRPPSDTDVKAVFLSAHPTWTVLSVGVGEGDSSAAYFHIKYRRPGETQVYEEVWQYLNDSNGNWKLANKEPAKVVTK